MATILTTFESMTIGSAPSNSEGVEAVGSPVGVISTTSPMHGAKSWRITNPGTATNSLRWNLAAQVTENSAYFMCDTIPPTEMTISYTSDATDATLNAVQVVVLPTTGFLRLRTKGTTRWTGTVNVCDGVKRRVAYYADAGTSATTGAVRIAIFDSDNLTALGDSGTPSSGASPATAGIDVAGSAGAFGKMRWGKVDSAAFTGILDFDSVTARTGVDASQTFAPMSLGAASTQSPISVLANPGGWAINGAVVTAAQALADSDDTTFIRSAGATTGESTTLRIDTLTAGNVAITYRARLAPSSTATQAKVELLQDTTVIKTVTQTLTTSWADYTITLTSGENSAITDRTKLRVRLTGNP